MFVYARRATPAHTAICLVSLTVCWCWVSVTTDLFYVCVHISYKLGNGGTVGGKCAEECLNGGTCDVDNECKCAIGYFGPHCEYMGKVE